MRKNLARQVFLAVLGLAICAPVQSQDPTDSQVRSVAIAPNSVADFSGEFSVLAFSGRRVVSSGKMSLTFDENGRVSGTWTLDYELPAQEQERSRYPSGSGEITGTLDLNSATLWLGFGAGGTLTFRGVLHTWRDEFTVFRGSWTVGGFTGPTYGGLLEITDRIELE